MDWRKCLKDVIEGRNPEWIPAVFRLDAWYRSNSHGGNLPIEIRGMSLEQVERYLGLGRSAREGKVFEACFNSDVELLQYCPGDRVVSEWKVDGKKLRRVQRYGPGDKEAGFSATTIEYPIKTIEDYGLYIKIVRNILFIPTYDAYAKYDEMIGNAGLPLVILGTCPFHDLFIRWTGYEQGFLDLHDHPDAVLAAVEAGNETGRRMWSIVAESPAELVMYGANFDAATTPPPLFREFFLPGLKEFNRLMHAAGKRVAFHADGDMRGLLDLAIEADYDVADCFACAPMVRCTMEAARQTWKDQIAIWGGVPSFMLEESFPAAKLEEHLERLFQTVSDGRRFILGLADQAMPTASWARIKRIARWAGEHGIGPRQSERSLV